jgi:hypothetical protein
MQAVVSVTCSGAATIRRRTSESAMEIIILGTSEPMTGTRMEAARRAVTAAIDEILDGTCSR